MEKTLRALAIGVVVFASVSAAHALDGQEIFEKLSPSIWVVATFDEQEQRLGIGSAVVISPGRVVTNCHVLEKAHSVILRRGNVAYGARLEYPDVERDLCQLSVAEFSAPVVEVAPQGTLRVGQRVYALGSPRGLELSLSDGILSALRRSDDGALEMIQTTAPISPGSSGGGLFDAAGRLIGITTAIARDSQNLNFAVPANWIAELPQRGKAALVAREQALKVKAEQATPSPYPRRMSADEIAAHFSRAALGHGKTSVSAHITFRIRGDGTINLTTNMYSAAGSGRLRFLPELAQVCIESADMVMMHARGCYQMYQTGQSEFSLRAVGDNYSIDYKI